MGSKAKQPKIKAAPIPPPPAERDDAEVSAARQVERRRPRGILADLLAGNPDQRKQTKLG